MRIFLYIFSAVFLINSIILTLRKSFTLGLAIMFFISFAFFITAKYWMFWESVTSYGIGLCFKYLICGGICAFLFLTVFILSCAHTTTDYTENAIIVLGCGLNSDDTPGDTLKNRLDGCVEYYKNNPDVYFIVSGGYSRQSVITESEGMKNYLISQGIPKQQILMESKAENTKQNFENCMEILKEAGIEIDNIGYVTNSFHVYRAGQYASDAGFKNAKCISVKTDAAVFIPAVLREVCGVAMMMIFNY